MNCQTVAASDESDDIFAGKRIAAARHIDKTIVDALDANTARGFRFTVNLLNLIDNGSGSFLFDFPISVIFVLNTGH